jgi:protein-S-isoprenylcysteine O-methyltransferase Ste14
VSYEALLRIIALVAVVPAGATLYFFVFWRWFEFWRRHRLATYALMIGTFVVIGVAAAHWSNELLAPRATVPLVVQGIGWTLMAIANLFGFIADRQIGLRVRSFTPFFEEQGRIQLETTGAYGVVRHPIYAAGVWFQLGAFLATGYVVALVACAVLLAGALWFTRQEERRLRELLDDPTAYDRYRARVPALLPWPRGGRRRT